MSTERIMAGKTMCFTDRDQPIRVVTVRMEKRLYDKLAELSISERTSMNKICIDLIEAATKQTNGKDSP